MVWFTSARSVWWLICGKYLPSSSLHWCYNWFISYHLVRLCVLVELCRSWNGFKQVFVQTIINKRIAYFSELTELIGIQETNASCDGLNACIHHSYHTHHRWQLYALLSCQYKKSILSSRSDHKKKRGLLHCSIIFFFFGSATLFTISVLGSSLWTTLFINGMNSKVWLLFTQFQFDGLIFFSFQVFLNINFMQNTWTIRPGYIFRWNGVLLTRSPCCFTLSTGKIALALTYNVIMERSTCQAFLSLFFHLPTSRTTYLPSDKPILFVGSFLLCPVKSIVSLPTKTDHPDTCSTVFRIMQPKNHHH